MKDYMEQSQVCSVSQLGLRRCENAKISPAQVKSVGPPK